MDKPYEPFGKEWKLEMNKWRKSDLIELLKKTLIEKDKNETDRDGKGMDNSHKN